MVYRYKSWAKHIILYLLATTHISDSSNYNKYIPYYLISYLGKYLQMIVRAYEMNGTIDLQLFNNVKKVVSEIKNVMKYRARTTLLLLGCIFWDVKDFFTDA